MLFVGAPGTGKTLAVRHLLGRYPETRRYLYLPESKEGRTGPGFAYMLERIQASTRPTIVVLEDVDRILESGEVTTGFLLNVLDGLLGPVTPVLWLARSSPGLRT